MKTRGRPKKEDSKSSVFKMRMSPDEMDILQFLSEKMRLSKSEVIRKLLYIYYQIYLRKH